jgi:hypothetical protein
MAAYLKAWTSNDADDIRALFTPDARYHPAPHVRAEIGHDRIVAWWQASRDEPGQWRFTWEPVAVTEQTAVVRGVTGYADGRSYNNLWVIEFAPDGRANGYTEWYMLVDPKDL